MELARATLDKVRGFEARVDEKSIRKGQNLIAVQISPPQEAKVEYNQTVLSVRLDPVPEIGKLTAATTEANVQAEVELVTKTPVVCDLCSTLPTQEPACVTHCPHEAAIRVDARFEFPD